ncbi:MAG: glycosyltransferase 87 family protein [Acutalibacteraceae bacterium]|nr:glycosyltransferase 87 family protein [Acutalibacteraceae bacterium]
MELSIGQKNNLKKYTDIFLGVIIFGTLLRFAIGVGYYNPQDTLWYKTWVLALNDGVFDIYARADSINLDYPPIYLFFLRILGIFYNIFGENVHSYTDMFVMKFFPIVGDILCAAALYLIFKKESPKTGLVAAALWMFNPTTIFNSSFWGQTDGIMCLLLLLSFVALERDKPILASVLFAACGMTKFQCLFFTPLFLTELFVKFRVSKFLKGISAAAITVAAVFLPFMIGSKNPFLFLDVYLKGQGTYPYCTLNAFNFYGILSLNWAPDSIGLPSAHMLSMWLIVVLIVLLILAYLFARRRSVWVLGFLFMNTLFMFMTRMHERYQFVVIIFILMAAIVHKNRGFFYCFMGISFITFINQLIPMFSWRQGGSVFSEYYGFLMVIFSVVNLIIYLLSAYVSVKFMFPKNKENITENREVNV